MDTLRRTAAARTRPAWQERDTALHVVARGQDAAGEAARRACVLALLAAGGLELLLVPNAQGLTAEQCAPPRRTRLRDFLRGVAAASALAAAHAGGEDTDELPGTGLAPTDVVEAADAEESSVYYGAAVDGYGE
jgi:hypothetical protein